MRGVRVSLLAVALAGVSPGGALAGGVPGGFGGDWRIGREVGAAAVSAMSGAELARLQGARLALGTRVVRVGKRVCSGARYGSRKMTGAAFREAYRLDPVSMGLGGGALDLLDVACGEVAFTLVAGGGRTVYLAEGEALLVSRK